MHIVSLQADNFKRLKAISIKPNGSVVEITGKNGQGKSSTLDAIWAALGGAGAAPAVPIRKGAEQAVLQLDLGKLKVTRTFTRDEKGETTTTVKIENEEGMRGGQRMLDALVSERMIDPLQFTRDKPEDQVKAIRAFVTGFDFEAADKANRDDYAARRDVNRDAKAARTRLEGVKVPALPPQADPVDETALVNELEVAGQHNADLEARRGRRDAAHTEIATALGAETRHREQAARLRAEADTAEKLADERKRHAAELQKRLDEAPVLPEPIATAELRQRISEARDHNARVQESQTAQAEHDRLKGEAEKLEASAAALTKAMDERKATMAKAIAATKMPVEGLALGEVDDKPVVLLDGLPFEQASTAQQLRVSVAVAAAANPRLKVAFVKDGSLLDADSFALLAEYAEKHGLQVWVETVDRKSDGAILIEDGSIATPASAADKQPTLV